MGAAVESSSHRGLRHDPAIAQVIASLASELRPGAELLASEMAAQIVNEVPALGHDPQAVEELVESCSSNIDNVISMLQRGLAFTEAQPPLLAVEYARSLVHQGIALTELLRAYRIGHAYLWSRWTQVVSDRLEGSAELTRTLERSSEFMFGYVDHVCDAISAEYEAERERWARSAAALRAETTQQLIAGEQLDADTASRRLRYELRRTHLGVVLWVGSLTGGASALGAMQAVATRLAASSDGEPLLVPAGGTELWAWIGGYGGLDELLAGLAELPAEAAENGIGVAVGEPGEGLDGFRRTHEEALQARRVAQLAGGEPSNLARRYRDCSLAALLCVDPERARRFAGAELGPLYADDEGMARLRETMRAYLDAQGSPSKAGRRLGVHGNTVAYRVRAAEELLGRPLARRRRELDAALLIAETLPPAPRSL